MTLILAGPAACSHCEGNLYTSGTGTAPLYCGDCHCTFDAGHKLVDAGSLCDTVDPLDMRNDAFALNEIGGCPCIVPEPVAEVLQPRLLT